MARAVFDDEPLLKKKDVVKFLNIGDSTLDAWLSDGEIKCCYIPKGGVRFDPDYIRSFKGTDFKNGIRSPEVKRLGREIKKKDEEIANLKNDLYEMHSEMSLLMNKLSQCIMKLANV
ncbi:hypothetical protein [Clostridium baratii]|uniref:hypothetical protein n=1 Tax=Clostridium baratii TaxID=1561 RepID=UPI0030CD4ABB